MGRFLTSERRTSLAITQYVSVSVSLSVSLCPKDTHTHTRTHAHAHTHMHTRTHAQCLSSQHVTIIVSISQSISRCNNLGSAAAIDDQATKKFYPEIKKERLKKVLIRSNENEII